MYLSAREQIASIQKTGETPPLELQKKLKELDKKKEFIETADPEKANLMQQQEEKKEELEKAIEG